MQNVLIVGIICALVMVSVSYGLNRWLARQPLVLDIYKLALYGSAVFFLAILIEVVVNTSYESIIGEKLWVYRVGPRHDGNVSLLAPIIWFAYGIHMYFADQTMTLRLPAGLRGDVTRSAITGIDAPLLFEVTGNLVFLALLGQYYAYYIPGELAHLTSVRVIPLYMIGIFVGLWVLRWLAARPMNWRLPAGLYAAGLAFLAIG